jgi:hypothetical protein
MPTCYRLLRREVVRDLVCFAGAFLTAGFVIASTAFCSESAVGAFGVSLATGGVLLTDSLPFRIESPGSGGAPG